jgi:hypothetical protein
MNKEILLKSIGIFFIILTVTNFILFVFGKVNMTQFWTILILCGLTAYFGLPRIKKNI